MTDTPQREMTLDEWVAKLPPFHRAVQELADLKERATAEAVPEPATHGAPSREALEALLAHTVGEIFKHAVASRGLFDPKNCPGCAAIVPTLLATIETVSTPTLRAPEVTDAEAHRFMDWLLDAFGCSYTKKQGEAIRRALADFLSNRTPTNRASAFP